MPSPPSTPSPPPSPRPAPPSTSPPFSVPSVTSAPLPSPSQKSSQKEEETLRPGSFSPRPSVASLLFQSPVLSDAFSTFDSLSVAIAEVGASLDLATLLRSFCDAGASILTPLPLPSPSQKFFQKEEETLCPGPFSPRPLVTFLLFQSPILSDSFVTFDSLSVAIAEAGASLDLATLLRSFCDAGASVLTPLPLPSPSQKFSQKEEETLRPGPFSPRPPIASFLFQSPILSDAFVTFNSLSIAIAEASASLNLATLLRSFCDAGASALPFPKIPSKRRKILRPGPFSPRPPCRFPPLLIPHPLRRLRHL